MQAEKFERLFPRLKGGYEITSPETDDYNCLAWAVGDSKHWWWFAPKYACYWPPGVARDNSLGSVIKLFEIHGYVPCSGPEREVGLEKVAIYEHAEYGVEHVARQVESGRWASKLGDWEDIEHSDPYALEGDDYGQIVAFMMRSRKDWIR